MTMKNPLRTLVPALVLAFLATSAGAQPKPSLVQDRDEPGRNPWQQVIQLTQNTTTCGALLALCSLTFDTVPAGKRLVVTHASVTFHTDPSTANPLAYAGPAQIPTFAVTLPLPEARGGTRHVASGPVLFYVEAGSYPYGIVQGFPLTDGASVAFALSGYFVNVP
jgi:hypothetical protein